MRDKRDLWPSARLARLAGSVTACMIDQGLISGANFLAGLILIRSVSAHAVGAFGVALVIVIFSQAIQRAFILDPLSVFGVREAGDFHAYFGFVRRLNFLMAIALGFVTAVCGLLILPVNSALGSALVVVAFNIPLTLDLGVLRRYGYVQNDPPVALFGSAPYALAMAFGIVFLSAGHHWSAPACLGMMGAANATGIMVLQRKIGAPPSLSHDRRSEVRREHLIFGKPLLGQLLSSWATDGLAVPVLGFTHGLAAAGIFKAVETLIVPLGQTMAALLQLFMPWGARRLSPQHGSVRSVLVALASAAGAVALLYGACLLVIAPAALAWLKVDRSSGTSIVTFLVIACAIRAVSDLSFGVVFRALDRPRLPFYAALSGAVLTGALIFPFSGHFGNVGAGAVRVIAAVAEITAATVLLARLPVLNLSSSDTQPGRGLASEVGL